MVRVVVSVLTTSTTPDTMRMTRSIRIMTGSMMALMRGSEISVSSPAPAN